MTRLRSNIGFFCAAVSSVCLVILTLSNIVTQPSRIIPELGGDGAKNIFTYLYHSMHGHGYWFQGMNYPYGEHIVYTDGQPVLSVLLSSIGGISAGQALTVLWLLIGLGYVLSILFIYKILVHYRVPILPAIMFAGLIGVFTPQILRLQGHYALSYTCIIPMLFYWTIRYHERFHWRYCLYFFATGCIMAFLHPYYAAMMLIWAVAYSAGYFLFIKGRFTDKIKQVAPIATSVFLVMVVVAVVMKNTDPVKDRPVTPFNTLYETCTRLKQLCTSYISPVWQPLLKTKSYHYISDGGEGYAYMGLVVIITAGIALLVFLLRRLREKRYDILVGDSGFSPVWLFMAFSVLLFGMGVPFIWHMEWLMNYIAIFKQFRSLGRFSWIFYYIFSIYTVIVINTYSAQLIARGKALAGYGIVVLALGIWGYECSGYIGYSRQLSRNALYNYDMIFSTHEQKWDGFLADHHMKGDDFQAILLLPFFHVGTEKLWVGYGNWLITLGSKASLQTGLPIINVMMSRSSWSQAMKQVKIAGGRYTEKPLLSEIKSNKPFLLMRFDEDTLNADQKYLLETADYLGRFSQCYVYACYPDRLAANDKKYGDSIRNVLPYMKQEDTMLAAHGTCYLEHYDTKPCSKFLFGQGSAPVIAHDSDIITTLNVSTGMDSELYEFSCWFLLSDQDPRAPNVKLKFIKADGKTDTTADALTRQSVDNYGMWFRSCKYFYLHNYIRSIQFTLMNSPNPSYLAMDEVMLRPADVTIISKGRDDKVMVNNHPFKVK